MTHFITGQQQLTADPSLILNLTESALELSPVSLPCRQDCHLHMGKLFVPTYGHRHKKVNKGNEGGQSLCNWVTFGWKKSNNKTETKTKQSPHLLSNKVSIVKMVFAWQLSVCSALLLMFQCRVTVMWRLQMGFLCRTIVPLIKSPVHTLTGLSSMNRVCFQCVGLGRGN